MADRRRSHEANRRAAARIDEELAAIGARPITLDDAAVILVDLADLGFLEDLGGGNYRLTEAGLREAEALIDQVNAVDN